MDFRAALIEETRAFGEIYRGADPSVPVPTCPGWTLRQLFTHLGRGHRWSAQIIADRRAEPLDPREVIGGRPPDDRDAAVDWLTESAHAIIDAVDRVGPDARVWTFTGPRPAGWWIRRRVHETVVHRADEILALGATFTLPGELAADAVSEWIDLAVLMHREEPGILRGASLHLHATDEGLGPAGEWTITHDDDGLNWTHDHAKGEAAVRGDATSLLLGITRRKSSANAGLQIFGDAGLWDGWLNRTPF